MHWEFILEYQTLILPAILIAKKAIDSRGDFILTRQGASNTEDKTRKLAES